MKHLSLRARAFILLLCSISVVYGRQLRVLAIGNSFSQDAVEQYLWQLAATQGDTLTIGNAYIGGCSIDRHWQNAQTGDSAYAYRKVVDGQRTEQPNTPLATIITDEPWDIITLQQASPLSGDSTSFGQLPALIDYVLQTVSDTLPQPQLMWHLTWAYPQRSKIQTFRDNYLGDQQTMYQAILATAEHVLPLVGITRRIPSGIAVQRARRAVGDVLNRDNLHLSLVDGRYTAACTWCEILTGKMVLGNSYHPSKMSIKTARLLQSAAHKAVMNDSLGWNDSLRVLWLGTKKGFYSPVPQMVRSLAADAGVSLNVVTQLHRGNNPELMMSDDQTGRLLSDGCWDYVVVQQPVPAPNDMVSMAARHLFPYDRRLDAAVLSASPDARLLCFNTWQQGEAYPIDYPMASPESSSLWAQLATTRPHAKSEWQPLRNSQWQARVGDAWRMVRLHRPDIQLYDARHHRPTTQGYYLTACVIVNAMLGRQVRAAYTAGLTAATASYLQQVAAQ